MRISLDADPEDSFDSDLELDGEDRERERERERERDRERDRERERDPLSPSVSISRSRERSGSGTAHPRGPVKGSARAPSIMAGAGARGADGASPAGYGSGSGSPSTFDQSSGVYSTSPARPRARAFDQRGAPQAPSWTRSQAWPHARSGERSAAVPKTQPKPKLQPQAPKPRGRYVYESSSDEDEDDDEDGSEDEDEDGDEDEDEDGDEDDGDGDGETPISSSLDASDSGSEVDGGGDSESASDSEEEQWHVAPGRVGTGAGGKLKPKLQSNGMGKAKEGTKTGGARGRGEEEKQAKKRAKEMVRRIRLASQVDNWEDWDRKSRERVWMAATTGLSSRYGLRASSRSRSHSVQPRSSAGAGVPDGPSSAARERHERELEEVAKLLSGLDLQRREEERREREAFERRNKGLWENIEASIREAEREQEAAASARAAALATARKRQEEAETRARLEREAEQRRIDFERAQAERQAQVAEEAKRASEEARRAEEEREARERAAANAASMGMGGGTGVRMAAEKEWRRWNEKMGRIKKEVLPAVSANQEWRKQCFAAKRQITPKVGQLTNSRAEIVRITTAISSVLTSARGASPSGEIYVWVLNHLSKCLIRQAEQEVAAKQDTAFPLARVVVWLMLLGHGELGEVLMARLNKKCPWTVGYLPGRKKDQDEAAYRKSLGHGGAEETSLQYTSRMTGILAFFAAVLQTMPSPPPSPSSSSSGSSPDLSLIPDHLRPSALWTWQVRYLSPPLLSHPLTPALWATFLEVAGPRLADLYGRQTVKVWSLLLNKGLREKSAGFANDPNAKAASTRLALLLEEWEKMGRLQGTGGREMEA